MKIYSSPYMTHIRAPIDTIRQVAADPKRLDYRTSEQSTFTKRAKLFYRGGGWWRVAGDMHRVVDKLWGI